jgi:hypothetical protein
MSDKIKELESLDQCLASVENNVKQLKDLANASSKNEDIHNKINSLADAMYACMGSIRNTMYDLHQSHASSLNKHISNGHAPAFKSNKHLENFLKACDMTDDYQTSPKDVSISSYSNMAYASKITASPKGMKVELDFTKPKKH